MKKILIALALLMPLSAFASITPSLPSPQLTNTDFSITCTSGNRLTVFDSAHTYHGSQTCPTSGFTASDIGMTAGVWDFYEINSSAFSCSSNEYADISTGTGGCSGVGDIVSHLVYTRIQAISGCMDTTATNYDPTANVEANYLCNYPPPPTRTGIAIFGGIAHRDGGTPTAFMGTDLVAGVAGAVGTTNAGIMPIVAIVIGIILTIILARWLIKTFKLASVQRNIRNTYRDIDNA